MTSEEREQLAHIDIDTDPTLQEWEDQALYSLPLGDEGLLLSNAGGEDQLCEDLFNNNRKRKDNRTRRDRISKMNKEWEAQLPILVDAYLAWQAGLAEAGLKDATVEPWQMLVVNFFNTEIRTFTPLSACARTNEVLVRGGFLGTAPQLPTVAISFQVLEAYRQLHHVCPRLSIYAQVKALCRLHAVPFNHPLVEQFSVAYDVYMDILHGVDRLVATALDRNTPNWCMLNACAPCLYYLDDEPLLKYSLLATMDGNQSLKLVDDQFRSGHLRDDGRSARTGIWILPEEVDRFKNEVRQSVRSGHGIRFSANASKSKRICWPQPASLPCHMVNLHAVQLPPQCKAPRIKCSIRMTRHVMKMSLG
ncbi:hypothetical protein WOLCODRAFT_111009 [Wolfiporia cocos MD-104 SS10]|uniref:CxC1-like cysteine cluster associated with KDZ transposases domain-containing protein n=1 Tax=Wolfiporia cocos (strain MD-104) TaxID=742152 RepID=A0A2H3J9L7_WOLCO|nr:hypothetical protein WOLCODRAFT_111009 [Wolfiporia cocos MD-104 SS10]